jgi:hypothetical protein
MADPSLTDLSLDPTARRVIGSYLAELADRIGSPPSARRRPGRRWPSSALPAP